MKLLVVIALIVAATSCKKKDAEPGAEFATANTAYCQGLSSSVLSTLADAKLVEGELHGEPLRSGYAACTFGQGKDTLAIGVDCKNESGMFYRKGQMLPNGFTELEIGKEAYRSMPGGFFYGIDTDGCGVTVEPNGKRDDEVEANDHALLHALAAHLKDPKNRPSW